MTDGTIYAVEMRGIVKAFPQIVANRRASIQVRAGEIHALIGENGAGKSTLMKILYGLYQPDEGTVWLRGRRAEIDEPLDAIRQGIGMVHQHFMLVPPLTVAENVILGMEPTRRGLTDRRRAEREIDELSEIYGLEIHPTARVQDLSVGLQQRVEIIKVLYRGAEILILDEPTAVLTPQEVLDLFKILRNLKAQGKTIIFITHKLKEVNALSDRVTVMRHGETVAMGLDTAATSTEELARLMVGRPVLLQVEKKPAAPGAVVLRVEGVSAMSSRRLPALKHVSLEIRGGEILGVAGVEGNGQSELLEVLTGLRRQTGGRILVGGVDVTGLSPRRILEAGVGVLREDPHAAGGGVSHIPEDRHKYGLVLDYSVADNLILGRHYRPPFAARGVMQAMAIAEFAGKAVREFDVRPPDFLAMVRTLSGGNQQKVIVARELNRSPRLLIAAQVTRGIDIGAIEFIHRKILEARDRGVAVLLMSAELSEIMSLSDRIAVMYGGEIAGIVEADRATEEELGLLMTGSRRLR